jgi:hypothetical protein
MDVVVWLRSRGLGKYEAIFRENDIDEAVLPSLTHENLKELGVASFGHRVKLLDAIAALRRDASGKPSSARRNAARVRVARSEISIMRAHDQDFGKCLLRAVDLRARR